MTPRRQLSSSTLPGKTCKGSEVISGLGRALRKQTNAPGTLWLRVISAFNPFLVHSPSPPKAAIASETALIHGRDSREYFLDRWKIPQVLALQMSLAGFVVRALYPGSTWGRGLYAVASPLMYWRLLYYAQILPSQGTTIQVGRLLYRLGRESGSLLYGFHDPDEVCASLFLGPAPLFPAFVSYPHCPCLARGIP